MTSIARLAGGLATSVILHVFLLLWLSGPLGGFGQGTSADRWQKNALQVAMPSARRQTAVPAEPDLVEPPSPLRPPPLQERLPGWNVYWPTSLLDALPEVVRDIPIDPPELRAHPEGGILVLTLWIGVDGGVDEVTLESTTLPDVFASTLRRDFLAARFIPGMRDGRPVRSKMRIELEVQPRPPKAEPAGAIVRPAAGRE